MTTSVAPLCRRQLFDDYRHLALRLAHRHRTRIPNGVSLDDLQQECKIALLKAAEQFDPDRGYHFASYATVVVARAARAFIRREYRQGFSGLARNAVPPRPQAHDLNDATPSALTYDGRPDRVAWNDEVWDKVLKCLSARERQVLELRLFKSFSNRQVSETLGFGVSRVSFLWRSAINRIKLAAGDTVKPF